MVEGRLAAPRGVRGLGERDRAGRELEMPRGAIEITKRVATDSSRDRSFERDDGREVRDRVSGEWHEHRIASFPDVSQST